MNTTVKHPHDAVIRAFLDGKVVQCRRPGQMWHEHVLDHSFSTPMFSADWEYRIKPKTTTVTHKYRRYIFKVDKAFHVSIFITTGPWGSPDTHDNFVKWIDDDWVTETYEVEVPS